MDDNIDKFQHPRKATWPLFGEVSHFGRWWELGAILVSLVSTSLILTILCFMNGRPLSDWELPIQLNSLIAIFSTVARSALLLALACLEWVANEPPPLPRQILRHKNRDGRR